ncbi:MAG TPA: hypothetical protein PKW35_15940, partial [Nannocystaceae bacterium]|nr:hypothetical protein [Nannocystaceae bacterium]
MALHRRISLVCAPLLAMSACSGSSGDAASGATEGSSTSDGTGTGTGTSGSGAETETGEPPALDVYGQANGCFTVRSDDSYLTAAGDGMSFSFAADPKGGDPRPRRRRRRCTSSTAGR